MLLPAVDLLAQQRGIDQGDYEAFAKSVAEDDSLVEEKAAEEGLTVEAYRTQQRLLAENRAYREQEEQREQEAEFREHINNLVAQGEDPKKRFPDFDLFTELQNPTFKRLTAPNSGCTVEAAYFAVHHSELEPQLMGYGIQRAQQQISQTIQANRQRPVEGAMKTAQPANIAMDPRMMTRNERQKLIERARRGERIEF